MSYFLHLCDCCVLYCASLEAWNWVGAGQHLNASHPRSSIWQNQNVSIFSGNYFRKTSGIWHNYINVIHCDSHRHYLDINTTESILNNPSGPQLNVIKYKFITWICSLFWLQMSSHMCVSQSVCVCVCLSVCLFTFEVSLRYFWGTFEVLFMYLWGTFDVGRNSRMDTER